MEAVLRVASERNERKFIEGPRQKPRAEKMTIRCGDCAFRGFFLMQSRDRTKRPKP